MCDFVIILGTKKIMFGILPLERFDRWQDHAGPASADDTGGCDRLRAPVYRP